jgi:hypothetical protein
MHHAGRALALDPTNAVALETMFELLRVPLREPPAEVLAEVDEQRAATTRRGAREGAAAFGLWLAFVPFGLWMGARDWTLALVAAAFVALSGALTLAASFRKSPRPLLMTVLGTSTIAIVLTSRIFGPMLVVPGLATAIAAVYSAGSDRMMRLGGVIAGVVAVVASFAIELSGVFGHLYTFRGGDMTVSGSIELHPLSAMVAIGLTCVALLLIPVLRSRTQLDQMTRNELDVRLRAWQLGWTVPRPPTRD